MIDSSMAYSFGRAFAHALMIPLLYPKLIQKILNLFVREDIPRIIDQYLTDDNSITLSSNIIYKRKVIIKYETSNAMELHS